MKWLGGFTPKGRREIMAEYIRHNENWHRWFAWRPVTVGTTPDGNREIMIWLQFVERKGRFIANYFRKPIPDPPIKLNPQNITLICYTKNNALWQWEYRERSDRCQ